PTEIDRDRGVTGRPSTWRIWSTRCVNRRLSNTSRIARWPIRARSSGLLIKWSTWLYDSIGSRAIGTSSPNVSSLARDQPDTTGVAQADSSDTRRAHMVGESSTELTFRKTLYIRYAASIWS